MINGNRTHLSSNSRLIANHLNPRLLIGEAVNLYCGDNVVVAFPIEAGNGGG
jgi:hypothetical protein